MKLFQRLQERFRPKPATARPFNMSDAQFFALKRLSVSEDYRALQDVLDQRVIIVSEQLLAAGDAFKLAQLQGTLLGLRIAGSLVDEAIQYELHADAERKQRNKQSPDRTPHARSALFGTPAGSTVFPTR